MPRSLARTLVAVVIAAAPLVLLGCPKKDEPAEAAAPAPTPPPPSLPDVDLIPLDVDDAGDASDADADADAKKVGVYVNPNTVRIMACCNAISAEANRLGNSPESFQLRSAAGICMGIARNIGSNAPEFSAIRSALGGRPIPGC